MGSNPILDINKKIMLYFLNRPISPHLTIYKPQLSSLLSIWHRISGVCLVVCFITLILISKLTIGLYVLKPLSVILNFFKYVYTLLNVFLILHIFNGFRNILLNFNYTHQLKYLGKYLILIIVLIFILTIKQIII